METADGISVLSGIAIGRIRFIKVHKTGFGGTEVGITTIPENCVAGELERFEAARQNAIAQQRELYRKAQAEVKGKAAAVFDVHAMMLEDNDLVSAIRGRITGKRYSAESAVRETIADETRIFADMTDAYIRARSADIIDIGQSLMDFLTDSSGELQQDGEPFIAAAADLTPSETIRLDRSKLLGFITEEGSPNSHTAILARSMNIPALVQVGKMPESWDGKMAILDGRSGHICVDPSEEQLASFRKQMEELREQQELLKEWRDRESLTADGRKIAILANIGGPEDIESVLDNNADGVGLVRTEYLYLGNAEEPSEGKQAADYSRILAAMAPKQVIFRTMDLGADKTIDYLGLSSESNPALGYRAIRICLTQEELFRKQLRALLRASVHGKMGIMFPMISSVWELIRAKEILAECRAELEKEGVPVGAYEIGTMIETPAAVMLADELAAESCFFSIGTNDLMQYTCALDRENAKLAPFSDPHHPAVLREIRMITEAAHRRGIRVALCGEMGADLSLTEQLLRMGIDELSVNPKSVLPLRRRIHGIDLS